MPTPLQSRLMKLTTLQLCFCVSLLVHGAVFAAVYAARYVQAHAQPASANGDLQTVEILIEPESVVVSTSEPQPFAVKIPEPMTEVIALKPAPIIPDEQRLPDAVETISIAQRDDPAVAKEEPVPTQPKEAKSTLVALATPVAVSSAAAREVVCLANPKPLYPREARRHKEQGLVVLGVTVVAEGFPADVRVTQSSGHVLLDEAALTTLKRWQFVPARIGNQVVSSQVQVPIRFRLLN